MRLRKLQLRGAIGIRKGIGLQEIEIDFSKFENGLIALVGKNGTGKTTIIENLHPFRRLVSKEGSLADHFELKDSFRILEYEHGSTVYSSEIYIDGTTKKVEAYLYNITDGKKFAINDGKPTTYDEAIERIFGSEDLFFNSVFSAQKSKGLANLTAGEKRELFYELLRLNNYEVLCEKAKSSAKLLEVERSKVTGIISILEEKHKEIQDAELRVAEAQKELNQLNEKLTDINAEIEVATEKKEALTGRSYQLTELLTSQEQAQKELDSIIQEIRTADRELEETIETLKAEKKTKLIDLELEGDAGTALHLEREQKEIELKLNKDIEEVVQEKSLSIQNSLAVLQENLAKTREILSKYEETLKTESEIALKVAHREQTKERLTQTIQAVQELLQESSKTEKNEQLELAGLLPMSEELQKCKQSLSELQNKKTNLIIDRDRLTKTIEDELTRAKEEVSIISQVPCTGEVGQKCLFLKRAYQTERELPEIELLHQQKRATLENLLLSAQTEIEGVGYRYSQIDSDLQTKTNEIISRYQRRYGEITAKKDRLEVEKANYEIELKNFDSGLDEQKKQVEIARYSIDGIKSKIASFETSVATGREKIEFIRQAEEGERALLAGKLAEISRQRANLSGKVQEDKAKIEKEFETQTKLAEQKHDATIKQLQIRKQITNSKIDPSIREEYSYCHAELQNVNNKLSYLTQASKNQQEVIDGAKLELHRWTDKLSSKSNLTAQIKEKKDEIRMLEKEIVDYNFLSRAFDKTGIPVLKLENSGTQITALANELLSNFDSSFRIAFDTTRLTKDKKKTKEVFDINVIDEDGVCELKNKSVGQQTWIETAIQLAVGLILRQQGKHIETSFLDEKDGSLDLENALNYRKMIESAHKKAGVYHTLVITHRKEIQSLIEQRIELKDGLTITQN